MDGSYIFIMGSIFYTSINFPYGSMASAISSNAKDRAELSTWRNIGATLDVMMGRFAPVGKLPITFPRNDEVLAVDENGKASVSIVYLAEPVSLSLCA